MTRSYSSAASARTCFSMVPTPSAARREAGPAAENVEVGKAFRGLQQVAPRSFSVDDVGKALVVGDAGVLVDAGTAKVGIDQERFAFLLAVDDGEVDGRGGFSFAGSRRSDEKRLGTAVSVGQQDGIAQGADGFFVGIGYAGGSAEEGATGTVG